MRKLAVVLCLFPCVGCRFEPAPLGIKRGEFVGTVVSVIDGDTITGVHDSQRITVELNGIDAPELDQEFGPEARECLVDLIKVSPVQVSDLGTNEFGNMLGDVYIQEGAYSTNASVQMLSQGYAWHDNKYGGASPIAEMFARTEKKGLWAKSEPVAPWEWRQRKELSDEH